MAQAMLDLAQVTESELKTLARNPEMQSDDLVVVRATSLKEAQDRFSDEWWSKVDGVIVRWGEDVLTNTLSYRMVILNQAIAGSSDREIKAAICRWIIRVIMPDGTVCDTRVPELPFNGYIDQNSPHDRHIVQFWGKRVPDLTDRGTRYFFRTNWFLLEVLEVALPTKELLDEQLG